VSPIRLLIAGVLILLPSIALAQSPTEKYFGVGLANFLAPVFSAGAEAIIPAGFGAGGTATLVGGVGWRTRGLTARAGFHHRDRNPKTGEVADDIFFFAESGYFWESDCCDGPLVGFGVGLSRQSNRASALRVEVRVLFPPAGEGALIMVQIGRTFR
jgi:hypothetical protein